MSFTKLFEVVTHNADTVLTIADLRKVHVMDCSGGNKIFTLPNIDSTHVGLYVILVRYNSNCTTIGTPPAEAAYGLKVNSSGMDVIIHSSPGGYIECVDMYHDYSSLYLMVIQDGLWGTPAFGVWDTY